MSYLQIQYDPYRVPRTQFPDQLARHLVTRLRLRSKASLLEIGAGRGDFAAAWNRAGFHVTTVDLEGSPTFRCDVTKEPLPFRDGYFDVVFTKSVIEHMWDASRMLQEARRVLRPGGVLIVMTPDWRSYRTMFWDDYTHCRPYDVVSLKDAMVAAGFGNARTELFHQYPPLWKHGWLLPLASLIRWTLPAEFTRWLTARTGIGLFRWSRELTVLGVAAKT